MSGKRSQLKIEAIIKKIVRKLANYKRWAINGVYQISIWRKPFKIMSVSETVEYIIKQKCSVARFGDGELSIAAYGTGIRFQKRDLALQQKLCDVIKNSGNDKLLICLPNRVNFVGRKRKTLPSFWQVALRDHLYNWTKDLDRKKLWGDTCFTRLTEGNNPYEKYAQIKEIKQIWGGRTIIIIEGDKTRFGVGNDLLDNVSKVFRILGPAENAFDYYNELLGATFTLIRKNNSDDILVLIALGPTATVLAAELAANGVQAIDIGHLDICYEWLRQGDFKAVPGKYTAESIGGDVVTDCYDKVYLSEIVWKYDDAIRN